MDKVAKEDRVLLVVANLVIDESSSSAAGYQSLYEWLDKYAIVVASMLMRPVYRFVEPLSGNQVTRQIFIDRVMELANDPQTKALDVILVMHGSPGSLYFDDGEVRSAELSKQIRAVNPASKLRLLYSTACYGASHAQDFVDAGFRTVCGAKGVCANGPYEFPTQLLHWGSNQTYRSTVKAGNNPVFRAIHDHAAKLLGFSDVDSEKIIVGRKYIRISSPVD